MRKLQAAVSRLRGIRATKDVIGGYFHCLQDKTPDGEAEKECPEADVGEWRVVTSRARSLAVETAPPIAVGEQI